MNVRVRTIESINNNPYITIDYNIKNHNKFTDARRDYITVDIAAHKPWGSVVRMSLFSKESLNNVLYYYYNFQFIFEGAIEEEYE